MIAALLCTTQFDDLDKKIFLENNKIIKIFDCFSKNIWPAPAPARETDCGEMNLGHVINSLQKKTNQTKF